MTVQKVKPGDYLLCYLTGASRFIGILEVVGAPYKDKTKIWSDSEFPSRLKVKPVAVLTPETGVPVKSLAGQLSFLPEAPTDSTWTGRFRGSPALWKPTDGLAVEKAILSAIKNPVTRPIPLSKLRYRPRALKAKFGQVTIPGLEPEDTNDVAAEKVPTEHTEIQSMLLTLGSDMGFDVWVARNDRSRIFKGKKLGELPRMKAELPLQFDEATNSTIELIDVLWLKGSAIIAAFEVESTTSIYSGLLRMADLVAMQPNINIPLYLVAPDARREKVTTEVNRPTFSRLSPKLHEICRYISFDVLRERVKLAEAFIKYLKPEFLTELSEGCELDDE